MIIALILFCVCLWRLVDVTDEVKSISVMKGDSVTLHTDVTEVQKYLFIQWMFGNTRIAEVGRLTQTYSTYDGPDGRFRGRLQLDQTGSLNITNTRTTDSGLYQLTAISSETSYMSFELTVYETPQSSITPGSSTSSNFVSSNLTINQAEDVNITELHQPSSGRPLVMLL
uniref:Immunoglobulin domain-containing protein n=1 Tax=Cyprinus carpio TaxID=7962 RepID=A0A8C1P6S4_CYPCA